MSRRATLATVGGLAALALIGAVAGDAPAELSDRWQEFKSPHGPEAGDTAGRFESASGNGRYQYWQAAIGANATDPLIGIGPGTYEFYWAREGTLPGYVRDAHSLYLEVLAELGIVGLLLVGGAMAALLLYAMRRAFAASDDARPWLAGATAACFAFFAAAAVDWVWELAVLPIVFLCIVAAILNHRERPVPEEPRTRKTRFALVAVAAASIVAVGVPLFGAKLVEASRNEVRDEQLTEALDHARNADDLQPWAATPPLQQALVLELDGDLDSAARAAAEATEAEPTNWRTWLTLSRIEAYRGNAEASVEAYRLARNLNPRSGLFAR